MIKGINCKNKTDRLFDKDLKKPYKKNGAIHKSPEPRRKFKVC